MSTLYVVATPIGNLGDITLRASEILKSVPLIAAEDTRVTRKLLDRIGSDVKTISYHESSPPGRLAQILEHLKTNDLALVTDAGTPAISDPGSTLVREAIAAGHAVTAAPGASSVTTALSISGFESNRFAFLGFLSRKKNERRSQLENVINLPMTLVVLEAPHRAQQTLQDLAAVAPNRALVVCRELTKMHEEVFRGTAEEAAAHFTQPKGEFVILIDAAPETVVEISDEEIVTAARAAIEDGLVGKSAVQKVVRTTGAPRSRVYPVVIAAQKGS